MDNFEELDRLVESCGHQTGNSAWPVYSFKDGKIIIIEAEVTLVAGAWPNPMAWYRTSGKLWRQTWKWANRLIVPNLTPPYCINKAAAIDAPQVAAIASSKTNVDWISWFAQRQNALRAYARTFPEEVLSLALSYSNGQWHMMCFMASCQGAIDLVRSSPALAYCLVNHKLLMQSGSGSDPVLEAQSWAYKKQDEILDWLGFPSTELAQRIMQKIIPIDVSVVGMRKLRKAMKNKNIASSLSRLTRINKPVLCMVNEPATLSSITHTVFNEIAMQDDSRIANRISYIREVEGKFNLEPTIFNQLHDIYSAESRLFSLEHELEILGLNTDETELDIMKMERLLNLEPHKPFNGIEEIVRYHNHLVALLPDESLGFVSVPETFPSPPYVGTKAIIPIRTIYELLKEDDETIHGAAAALYPMARGSMYVYRVVRPVRATLYISKNHLGSWECDRMKGVGRISFGIDSARDVFAILTNSQQNNH